MGQAYPPPPRDWIYLQYVVFWFYCSHNHSSLCNQRKWGLCLRTMDYRQSAIISLDGQALAKILAISWRDGILLGHALNMPRYIRSRLLLWTTFLWYSAERSGRIG